MSRWLPHCDVASAAAVAASAAAAIPRWPLRFPLKGPAGRASPPRLYNRLFYNRLPFLAPPPPIQTRSPMRREMRMRCALRLLCGGAAFRQQRRVSPRRAQHNTALSLARSLAPPLARTTRRRMPRAPALPRCSTVRRVLLPRAAAAAAASRSYLLSFSLSPAFADDEDDVSRFSLFFLLPP